MSAYQPHRLLLLAAPVAAHRRPRPLLSCLELCPAALCCCRFSDYVQSASGLQYQDFKVGEGPAPQLGQTCVVDWGGYTIGYYGRPFEARNKVGDGWVPGGR